LTNEAAFQALRWLVEGQHEKHVLEALAAQFPAADPAATLDAVMAHLAAIAAADPIILRGFALAAYREIYQRCMATGDFPTAIRCVKELDRIAAPQLPVTAPSDEPHVPHRAT